MPRLPHVLAEIADAAGEEAAHVLAAERGGTVVYIPKAPGPNHWLSRLVGADAALAIADRLTCGLGGLHVDVPLAGEGYQARGRAEVDRLIEAGGSERDIARATGYTVRGVRKRKARLAGRDDRQLDMF